jgi:hypothetical protein
LRTERLSFFRQTQWANRDRETHTLTGPQYIPRGETNQAMSNRRDIQVGDVGGTCSNKGKVNDVYVYVGRLVHAQKTVL